MPFDINDHSYSASQDLLDLTSKNDVIWRSTGMVMFSMYHQELKCIMFPHLFPELLLVNCQPFCLCQTNECSTVCRCDLSTSKSSYFVTFLIYHFFLKYFPTIKVDENCAFISILRR